MGHQRAFLSLWAPSGARKERFPSLGPPVGPYRAFSLLRAYGGAVRTGDFVPVAKRRFQLSDCRFFGLVGQWVFEDPQRGNSFFGTPQRAFCLFEALLVGRKERFPSLEPLAGVFREFCA